MDVLASPADPGLAGLVGLVVFECFFGRAVMALGLPALVNLVTVLADVIAEVFPETLVGADDAIIPVDDRYVTGDPVKKYLDLLLPAVGVGYRPGHFQNIFDRPVRRFPQGNAVAHIMRRPAILVDADGIGNTGLTVLEYFLGDAFVAGPVIRKTSTAPGVNPFNISTAAIGTDAVAHT